MASCNVTDLLSRASAFAGLSPGQLQAIQTQLLCEIAESSGASCNVATLLAAANRFLALEPGQLLTIKAQLLCEIRLNEPDAGCPAFVQQCSAASLLTDLMGHWKLDEASGQRSDSSGRGNHLSDNNTVGQACGKINEAASFVRANSEYLSIPSNADLTFDSEDFTIAAWVYLASNDSVTIAAKDDGTDLEYRLYYTGAAGSERFAFQCNTEAVGAEAFGLPALDTWHFVVAWQEIGSETINIQVNDGAINSSGTGGIFTGAGTASFRIGARQAAGSENYMNGRVDSVSVWRRVLTNVERTALYCAGNGLNYPFS